MYTWRCKECGFTFTHKDRERVNEVRYNHKIIVDPYMKTKTCPMEDTGRGTKARPDLAAHIREQLKAEK